MRATGSGQSALLLLDVIDVLTTLRVPYAVIGAVAASFHGVVRASMDADAVISLTPNESDLKGVVDALRNAGLKSSSRIGDNRDPIGGVIHVEDRFHNRVDLLVKIRGVTEAVFTRTIETAFMQSRIRVIGIEDFIAMKIFAGSPKDVSDAIGVLRVSYDRIDLTLLRRLVQPYGAHARRTLESLLRTSGPST